MKKTICILLIALLSVSLFACGKKVDEAQKPDADTNNSETQSSSEADTADLNKINSKHMIIKTVDEPSANRQSENVIHDDFIIKEKSNTSLTMAKYDKKSEQELKSLLYRGDYGKLDNAKKLDLKVGDVITVYYDENVMETYPCQIIIRKIIELSDEQTDDSINNDPVSAVDIIDIAERDEIPLAQAIEWFYSDSAYKYYYPCIKSKYVIVRYSDGSKETAESALKNGKITISDLDKFDIEYGKEKR